MADDFVKQEIPLSEEEWEEINRNNATTNQKSKDSVFVNLFEDKNNILQLYKELHPENTNVTVNDISVQTLKAVLINTIYNDLGFIVKEGNNAKYVLLVEAQSGWNHKWHFVCCFTLRKLIVDFLDNQSRVNTRIQG